MLRRKLLSGESIRFCLGQTLSLKLCGPQIVLTQLLKSKLLKSQFLGSLGIGLTFSFSRSLLLQLFFISRFGCQTGLLLLLIQYFSSDAKIFFFLSLFILLFQH